MATNYTFMHMYKILETDMRLKQRFFYVYMYNSRIPLCFARKNFTLHNKKE